MVDGRRLVDFRGVLVDGSRLGFTVEDMQNVEGEGERALPTLMGEKGGGGRTLKERERERRRKKNKKKKKKEKKYEGASC